MTIDENSQLCQDQRSYLAMKIRSVANWFRSFIRFKIRQRWIQTSGFTRIHGTVHLNAPHHIMTMGDKVQLGPHCHVSCDIHFGNNVLCAGHVSFIGKNEHRFDIPCMTVWDSPRGVDKPTIVGNDVWIGHGAIILGGVRIGNGAVVAAGAVVTHDVPECTIVVGNPARVVKNRFENKVDIEAHKHFCMDL